MSEVLNGKRAIITGGSQGLGKEIAEQFLKEGASVVICSRKQEEIEITERELSKAYPEARILAVAADVSKETDTIKLRDKCLATYGGVDILVNNAGVHGAKGEIDQIDLQDWKAAIEINLYGMVHMVRAVVPYMKRNGYGKIISLSGGGATSPRPFFSAYAASKCAIVRLTENFARELQPYHIDINAIAPGAMNTRLLDDILSSGKEVIGEEYYAALKQQEKGGVDPVIPAKLCVHLASGESDGITGRIISAVWDDWDKIVENKEQIIKSDIYTLRRIIPKERGFDWDE